MILIFFLLYFAILCGQIIGRILRSDNERREQQIWDACLGKDVS